MKWLMLIAVVLLAVQFVACEDEEKIAELEGQKVDLTEEIGSLEEDLAVVEGDLALLREYKLYADGISFGSLNIEQSENSSADVFSVSFDLGEDRILEAFRLLFDNEYLAVPLLGTGFEANLLWIFRINNNMLTGFMVATDPGVIETVSTTLEDSENLPVLLPFENTGDYSAKLVSSDSESIDVYTRINIASAKVLTLEQQTDYPEHPYRGTGIFC